VDAIVPLEFPALPPHPIIGCAPQETFLQDRYAFLQQAQQNRSIGLADQTVGAFAGTVVTNEQLFVSCMIARGYVKDENGNLFLPSEAVVRAQ
jgi:hypothetical protein